MCQFSFEEHVMPLVIGYAKWNFRGRPDRDEMVADAVSLAWEGYRTAGPEVTPSNLAWYAIRRARVRRMFSESCRSLDGPVTRCGVVKPQPVQITLESLAGRSDDPADVAAMRIDVPVWTATLTEFQFAVLARLLMGETTLAIAGQLDRSPARISQVRRELMDSWHLFTA